MVVSRNMASRSSVSRAGSTAGADSAVMVPASRVISASSGDRWAGCNVTATNRERTSSAAATEAAVACARNIGGSALVGLLLAQAATTSLTA